METTSRKRKNARLDLRLPTDTKELLQKAATLAGLDLTAFTLSAAIEKADEVLARHNTRLLSDKERDRFLDILENEEPNEKLLNSVAQYKAMKDD